MLEALIMSIIKGLFSFLGQDKQEAIQSELEMFKGRAESIESSYSEQEKATKAAKNVEANLTNSSEDDVFGSEDYDAE